YVWTQNVTTASNTAFVLAYRNVLNIDGLSNSAQFSSASANFSPSVVGDLICIAQIGGGSPGQGTGLQPCGTITAYVNPTTVTTSITPNNLSPQSGLQFAYGHDDYAAFNQMLTTAPCSTTGCKVILGPVDYTLSNGLNIPLHSTISIEGVAS